MGTRSQRPIDAVSAPARATVSADGPTHAARELATRSALAQDLPAPVAVVLESAPPERSRARPPRGRVAGRRRENSPMVALEVFGARGAEDEFLELLARGIREAAEVRPRAILHLVGEVDEA
jgi:hypothetical protein